GPRPCPNDCWRATRTHSFLHSRERSPHAWSGRKMKHLVHQAKSLLFEKEGTLTRQLLREPGGFGLGQVPSRLKPDATTTAVCGFCSTGCGLDVHLKDGEAINLSPAKDYSVNLGMACPKGWEALTPLSAPDRATHPLLRNEAGRLERVSWRTAL